MSSSAGERALVLGALAVATAAIGFLVVIGNGPELRAEAAREHGRERPSVHRAALEASRVDVAPRERQDVTAVTRSPGDVAESAPARSTRCVVIYLDEIPPGELDATPTVELVEFDVDDPWTEIAAAPGGQVRFDEVPTELPLMARLQLSPGSEPLFHELEIRAGAEHSSEIVRIDVTELRRQQMPPVPVLRAIAAAQQQLQASAAIDTDGDLGGEHGYFGELAGTDPIRGYDAALGAIHGEQYGVHLDPTFLPVAFGNVESAHGGGVVRKGLYYYRAFLPGEAPSTGHHAGRHAPLAEAQGGGAGAELPDPDAAERLWCVYAWPVRAGFPDRTTYFIHQGGDVLAHTQAPYAGRDGGPQGDAAYTVESDMGSEAGIRAAGRMAVDGGAWHPVGY